MVRNSTEAHSVSKNCSFLLCALDFLGSPIRFSSYVKIYIVAAGQLALITSSLCTICCCVATFTKLREGVISGYKSTSASTCPMPHLQSVLSKRAGGGGIVTVTRGQCRRLLVYNGRGNQELPARSYSK